MKGLEFRWCRLRAVIHRWVVSFMLLVLPALAAGTAGPAAEAGPEPEVLGKQPRLEAGQRMYRDGLLPSGERMTGIVSGDIPLSGDQVICGWCHRRSGMGSTEGQEVVPAVTGDMLYNPLRLPTSKPPLAPIQRPAYTDETLKRAIREGVGPDGKPFSALMPRYPLSDEELDILLDYLKTLSTDPDPGVDERDIHFATILTDAVDDDARDAFLSVFEAFFAQKNTETRHESFRAEHAPWHKEWVFGPYRKWVLHVWELKGERETWPEQLRAHYERTPVFAVLSGIAPGAWRPVHEFCEASQLPCLFPVTDLPEVAEKDFYSVYFSPGMTLEADAVARHLTDEGRLSAPIVQVSRADEPRSAVAAERLRHRLTELGGRVTDFAVSGPGAITDELWDAVVREIQKGTLVLWLEKPDVDAAMAKSLGADDLRIYLSTTLYGLDPSAVPVEARDLTYLVHPYELPAKLPRLLIRSRGWLRAHKIYEPGALKVQANAFFALKAAGGALKAIQGYFLRDYLLERIEHMTEDATYTSVYPRMNLAPGQRFVSRSAYIVKPAADDTTGLVPVTDWTNPASNQ